MNSKKRIVSTEESASSNPLRSSPGNIDRPTLRSGRSPMSISIDKCNASGGSNAVGDDRTPPPKRCCTRPNGEESIMNIVGTPTSVSAEEEILWRNRQQRDITDPLRPLCLFLSTPPPPPPSQPEETAVPSDEELQLLWKQQDDLFEKQKFHLQTYYNYLLYKMEAMGTQCTEARFPGAERREMEAMGAGAHKSSKASLPDMVMLVIWKDVQENGEGKYTKYLVRIGRIILENKNDQRDIKDIELFPCDKDGNLTTRSSKPDATGMSLVALMRNHLDSEDDLRKMCNAVKDRQSIFLRVNYDPLFRPVHDYFVACIGSNAVPSLPLLEDHGSASLSS